MNQNKKRMGLSSNSLNDLNNNIPIITEEQINKDIQQVKIMEQTYNSSFNNAKQKFINNVKLCKDKTRNVICNLANELKESISDGMVFLQNCYKIPLSELSGYIQEVTKLDEASKFNEIVVSSYKMYVSQKKIPCPDGSKITSKVWHLRQLSKIYP